MFSSTSSVGLLVKLHIGNKKETCSRPSTDIVVSGATMSNALVNREVAQLLPRELKAKINKAKDTAKVGMIYTGK